MISLFSQLKRSISFLSSQNTFINLDHLCLYMLFLSCQESLTFYLLVVFQNSGKLTTPVGSGLDKISNNNVLVHLKKGWQVGLTRNWARCFDNNENETKCATSSNTCVNNIFFHSVFVKLY